MIFPKHNLHVFIPAFKILRTSVIKVSQQIDLETLKECIESSKAKVLDVQRFNRRSVRDGKVKYIPSRTIRIRFVRQLLPQEVFNTRLNMRFVPYIMVLLRIP